MRYGRTETDKVPRRSFIEARSVAPVSEEFGTSPQESLAPNETDRS